MAVASFARPLGTPKSHAPTGLVTFLFTDIEDSTQRWESSSEAMRLALRRHDRLLRQAIESHGGRVFKTMGDQFCAAFRNPIEAAIAALDAQRVLAAADWSGVDGLRVRMAVHTGVTDETDGDYYGPAVNRVARLLSIGHGGQVLLSGFVADLIHHHLPAGSELRDLGTHRLKGLATPERVYQLVPSGTAHAFPELRSLGSPNNLPLQLTAFLGRKNELAMVGHLVATSRLVTLTGTGGVGKTRTALQIATSMLDDFRDGVWLVELAPLADPALVPSAIAEVFHVEDAGGSRPLIENVAMALHDRNALILLDNCEHVVAAAAYAAEHLLRACPNLRIVATSREALRIAGEREYRMPSLAVPPQDCNPRKVAGYCAVALFVERASAAEHRFALTDANAPAVAEIVRRLDGIALAIELAAPLVKVLPVESIASHLDERFAFLRGGSRTALPRQQTLRALIDWSYDLLDRAERDVLTQVAVFRDGWTLEAAEAVCHTEDERDLFAILSKLVDKSLVVADDGGGARRYRLLESTRHYALERLRESSTGDAAAAERHFRYFCDRAAALYEAFWRTNRDRSVALLRAEIDNYRGAIAWGLTDENDVPAGAGLVADLNEAWYAFLGGEGQVLVARALEAVGAGDPLLRGRLLVTQAAIGSNGGLGLDAATEAVALLERGERLDHILALRQLGNALGKVGRGDEAVARFRQALAFARPLGLVRLTAQVLNWLGFWLSADGAYGQARAAFDEAIELLRVEGDPAAMPLPNLAELLFAVGDVRGAIATVREGLAVAREFSLRGETDCTLNLAAYLLAAGEMREAWKRARTALQLCLQQSRAMSAAVAIQHLAQIAAREGYGELAARLLGYVDAAYERQRHVREPTERFGYQRVVAILRAAYAPSRLATFGMEGAALGEAAAAALAMTVPQPVASQAGL